MREIIMASTAEMAAKGPRRETNIQITGARLGGPEEIMRRLWTKKKSGRKPGMRSKTGGIASRTAVILQRTGGG